MTYLESLMINYWGNKIDVINHLERDEEWLRKIISGEYPNDWISPRAIAEYKTELDFILENIDKL